MSNPQPSQAPEVTFSFGENWKSFLTVLDADKIKTAQTDVEGWVGPYINGARIVDVGCGSGLHSLCFYQLGAEELVSFDLDPASVEATRVLHERAQKPTSWRVESGSALDDEYLNSLGHFDIVYSWGVLHHTGSMWKAIENTLRLVKPEGLIWLSLYAKGDRYNADLKLKQRYNRASVFGKKLILWRFVGGDVANRVRHRVRPIFPWKSYGPRGMDFWHDQLDWLGGLPYEVATPEEVEAFMNDRGFTLEKQRLNPDNPVDGGCHVYLYRRESQ